MGSTLPPPADRRLPMRLADQYGQIAYAWFPPGTHTDPEHVLPGPVYAEVCRLAGVGGGSPWVAFRDRVDALAAVAVALAASGCRSG